jgi:Predicted metal-binding integral membrane protein (DUF2182)
MPRVRRNVWTLPQGDKTLERYGKAVEVLQQRPISDVTSVLRYGIRHVISCIGTCWGFMLLTLSASGLLHWITMASAVLLSLIESVRPPVAVRWGAALPDLPRPLPTRPMRMGALR